MPPLRPSTLDERRRFYAREFDLRKVRSWFAGRRLPQLCAVDAGSETGIIVDEKLKGEVLYFPFSELRKKLSKYAPEDVYYDRNVYDDPKRVLRTLRFGAWREQELVFDIDADNIPCTHPKTQDACPRCIAKALSSAKRIKVTLGKEYRDVRIVYSGRGFHVHVLDDEAWRLSVAQRERLVRRFAKVPIDQWVTRSRIRLVRMPYSLNALVSRVAVPVRGRIPKAIPRFLRQPRRAFLP